MLCKDCFGEIKECECPKEVYEFRKSDNYKFVPINLALIFDPKKEGKTWDWVNKPSLKKSTR